MTSKKRIIASLTTYSKRINTVHLAIQTIINQTLKADKIILWLAEDEFSKNTIPKNLLKLVNKGLDIRFCEDIKSYKKLIPTLKLYPDDIIITFDDDVYYEVDTIETLYNSYIKNKNNIHTIRGHLITFKNQKINEYNKWEHKLYKKEKGLLVFPTGIAGVLYPPNCFYQDILKKELFLSLAPHADDIWLKAMSLLNHVECQTIEGVDEKYIEPQTILGTQENGLWLTINSKPNGNDKQLEAVFNYYNITYENFKKELV